MTKTTKNALIGIVALAIVFAALIGTGVINLNSANLPQDFVSGRKEAAKASEQVSKLFKKSLDNLSVIARYEREGQTQDALDLLQEEKDNSAERNNAAIELAKAIDKMAQASKQIESSDAREVAVEAVSSQVAAITHMLAFNNFFDRLHEQIQRKLEGEDPNILTIESTLNQLNEEVEEINKLNEEFTNSLREFDKIVRMQ
ncbi:MAG: hypothetical protein R3B52_01635 [Candidatus Paceibacterota bacterium]